MSAQEAELTALTETWKMAEGKIANVYTDFSYAFGIAHNYGLIWHSRDFVGSKEKHIKNAQAVKQFFDTLMLPKEVGMIKFQAHTKENTPKAKGKKLADKEAKAAVLLPLSDVMVYVAQTAPGPMDLHMIGLFQKQASQVERSQWKEKQAVQSEDCI